MLGAMDVEQRSGRSTNSHAATLELTFGARQDKSSKIKLSQLSPPLLASRVHSIGFLYRLAVVYEVTR